VNFDKTLLSLTFNFSNNKQVRNQRQNENKVDWTQS